jgi:superfamily II DNA or RNA helicase
VAPTYAEAVSVAGRYARRFGFTATPEGRSDRADPELEGLFGPRIFEMGYQEALDAGLVVPIEVIWTDCVLESNPAAGCRSDTARQRYGCWRNDGRNALIARIARSYHASEQVLIRVDRVEHALCLAAALPEFSVCFAQLEAEEERVWEQSGLVDLSRIHRTDGDRRALREGFSRGDVKKVIATGVWSRGVSFDALSVLILGGVQGRIAWTQTPGRVSRLHAGSGKQVGVVHAIRDCFDAGFKASAAKMAAVFRSHGWSQTRVKAEAWQAAG